MDVAWMAGFYEGEGSVSHRDGKRLNVSMPQKDAEVLLRIREFTGGSISKIDREESHLHTLNVCGDGARQFLQAIYPLLSTRRKMQVEAAGGLTFTGRKQWGVKTTDERRELRMTMTEAQKQVESTSAYKERDRDADRAYQREYRKRNLPKMREHYNRYVSENREHVNSLQRAAYARRKESKSFVSEVIQ